jgi:hypothetical protein
MNVRAIQITLFIVTCAVTALIYRFGRGEDAAPSAQDAAAENERPAVNSENVRLAGQILTPALIAERSQKFLDDVDVGGDKTAVGSLIEREAQKYGLPYLAELEWMRERFAKIHESEAARDTTISGLLDLSARYPRTYIDIYARTVAAQLQVDAGDTAAAYAAVDTDLDRYPADVLELEMYGVPLRTRITVQRAFYLEKLDKRQAIEQYQQIAQNRELYGDDGVALALQRAAQIGGP